MSNLNRPFQTVILEAEIMFHYHTKYENKSEQANQRKPSTNLPQHQDNLVYVAVRILP